MSRLTCIFLQLRPMGCIGFDPIVREVQLVAYTQTLFTLVKDLQVVLSTKPPAWNYTSCSGPVPRDFTLTLCRRRPKSCYLTRFILALTTMTKLKSSSLFV